MGDETGIEWTDKTWNPWVGCAKVSAGCKNCHMYREMQRYHPDAEPGSSFDPAVATRTSGSTFNKPMKWTETAKVFTCSWSDFFIEAADAWREEAWKIIRMTPHLTYQILTKRPENIIERLPPDWGEDGYANVWLGVTVENQAVAEMRIPILLSIPTRLRFLSVEPMLSEVDISDYLNIPDGIGWVIIGAESGPGHRDTDGDWVEDLSIQCDIFDVPVFIKQLWMNGKLIKTPIFRGMIRTDMPGETIGFTIQAQKGLFDFE